MAYSFLIWSKKKCQEAKVVIPVFLHLYFITLILNYLGNKEQYFMQQRS